MKILCVETSDLYEKVLGDDLYDLDVEFNGYKYINKNHNSLKKYDAVFCIQYLWPCVSIVAMKAKMAGIPVFLFSDGILEWENNFQHHAVIKNNRILFKDRISDFVLVPGIFESRFIHYNGVSFIPNNIRLKNNIRIQVNDMNPILITTANTAYFNEFEYERLLKLLKNIIKSSDKKIIFRIFDEKIRCDLNISDENNFLNESFEELLEKCSAVISTPSSVVLTSMLKGIPTCQLIYRDAPLFLQSGWMMHDSCNIKQTLIDLNSNNIERMKYQKYQLENYKSLDLDSNKIQCIISEGKNFSEEPSNHFYESEIYKILTSPFNFNVEFFIRKLYSKFNKTFNK